MCRNPSCARRCISGLACSGLSYPDFEIADENEKQDNGRRSAHTLNLPRPAICACEVFGTDSLYEFHSCLLRRATRIHCRLAYWMSMPAIHLSYNSLNMPCELQCELQVRRPPCQLARRCQHEDMHAYNYVCKLNKCLRLYMMMTCLLHTCMQSGTNTHACTIPVSFKLQSFTHA